MTHCDVAVIGVGPAGLSAALAAKKVGAEHVRASIGRCQTSFCMPRVMEILCRELGLPMEQIRKNEPSSELLAGMLGEVHA